VTVARTEARRTMRNNFFCRTTRDGSLFFTKTLFTDAFFLRNGLFF
jgi:hypothetical protein